MNSRRRRWADEAGAPAGAGASPRCAAPQGKTAVTRRASRRRPVLKHRRKGVPGPVEGFFYRVGGSGRGGQVRLSTGPLCGPVGKGKAVHAWSGGRGSAPLAASAATPPAPAGANGTPSNERSEVEGV